MPIKYSNKNTLILSRYFVIFCISLLAFLFVPSDALDIDLYRYYFDSKLIPKNITIFELIQTYYYYGLDFVYYLILFLLNRFGLPIQLVTGLSVGLLYANTQTLIDLSQKKYKYKFKKINDILLRTFAFLSVSFIIVFGISRNVTAIMFFFYGVNSLLKGKKFWALISFLLAAFTHSSLIIYSLVFFFSYYLNGKYINNIYRRRFLIVLATILGLTSYLWMKSIFTQLATFRFFDIFSHYLIYMEIDGSVNIFNFAIPRADALMLYTSSFILFYALYFLKKYNPIIWVCFVLYIILVISMGFSHMFTLRTLLFLIPLQGVVASAFFAQQNKKIVKITYKLLLIIGILAFILNVYAYRDYWIFRFPNF